MMDRSAKYWADILNSIEGIESYVAGIASLNEYVTDRKTKRAVERELAIIGEAMNHLRKLDPTLSVPFADRIVSLRNRLIHSYDNIDDSIVWGIVRNHLPSLKEEVLKHSK